MPDQLERVAEAIDQYINDTPLARDVARAVLEALRDLSVQVGTCAWWEDGEMWESSCGVTYMFNSDGPEDNGHCFCHKCGKRIEIDVARQEGP
jgi:hypothetical protein